jgi:hypothetical protein
MQLLMDRLRVHSMLPKRHGGIGEGYSKIIAIDTGNCSDDYGSYFSINSKDKYLVFLVLFIALS